AINNAPKEICGQCHVEIPFSLLKEHIETCKGLDIDEESDGNHLNDQSQTISARNCNTTTSSSTSLSMAFNRCTLEYAVTLLSHHVVDRIHMDYNKDNGDDYDYQNYQRVNILRSTFWKTAVRAINRPDFLPNKLIKVSFIGESAVDDGGPRREFCSLLINSVKTCGVLEGKENNLSFSHDLRFLAERRYFTAGKMVAISLCHGGPGLHCLSQATFQYMARGCVEQPIAIDEIPDYDIQLIAKQIQSSETNEELRIAVSRIGEESVANITGFTDPMSTITLDMKAPILVNLTTHHCVYKSIPEINQFLDGMNVLHIADLVKAEPGKFTVALKIFNIGDEGAQTCLVIDGVYHWIYCMDGDENEKLRIIDNQPIEVVITLGDIFAFFTGTHSIPPLGFTESPSIEFITNSTVPSSNTCANILRLPRNFSCIEDFSERFTFALSNCRDFGNV
ncbi:G2/M phase-specific E3 ubiquitin-protein ligase-like, partial [Saccoglossus kowalevskii]